MTSNDATSPVAGWYDDGSGRQRWWDGSQWGEQYRDAPAPQPAPVTHSMGPMTSSKLNVERKVVYTRPQKGHSIIAMICIDWITVYIRTIYYSFSPNHYWHI